MPAQRQVTPGAGVTISEATPGQFIIDTARATDTEAMAATDNTKALTSANRRAVEHEVDVNWFNGSIADAVAFLPVEGGAIKLDAATYTIDDTSDIVLDDKRSVTFRGVAAQSAGATPATRILYTGTGTMLSALSAVGITFEDIWFQFNNAAHSGVLLDLGHSAAATDTSQITFERCMIGSGTPSIQGTGVLVSLEKAINVTFNETNFFGGNIGVRGRSGAAVYSNVVQFNNSRFRYFNDIPILNAGQAWDFDGCTFQQLYPAGVSGGAGALRQAAGISANGVSLDACWFGDANVTGTWIDYIGAGLNVGGGNYVAGGVNGVILRAGSSGVVAANVFDTMTNAIVAEDNAVLHEVGNSFPGVTTPVTVATSTLGQWTVSGVRTMRGKTDVRATTDAADVFRVIGAGGTVIAHVNTSSGRFGVMVAGAAHSTLHTGGSFATAYATVTAATTLNANHSVVAANATTAAFTVTLPTAAAVAGRTYHIKKIDSSANAVTVGTTSAQTIDGAATKSLAAQWATITVVSDGANWLTL